MTRVNTNGMPANCGGVILCGRLGCIRVAECSDGMCEPCHVADAFCVSPARVALVVEQAELDAMDMATDVRDTDPREIWARLAMWARDDPQRLLACTVALASMVDVTRPVSELLAWTESFAQKGAA